MRKAQQMLGSANWSAILLFSALLAQAPHAAYVFLRIAPHDDEAGTGVAIALAVVGSIVYAVALEGATAYFVWHNAGRIAVAFAVFSFLHNVAYYMPTEWGIDAWGAWLSVRFILSMLLISASLPIAIAAFSHVQAEAMQRKLEHPAPAGDMPAWQTVSLATVPGDDHVSQPVCEKTIPGDDYVATAQESQHEKRTCIVSTPATTQARRAAILAHLQNGWSGERAATEIVATIAREFDANRSTIYRDLQALQEAGAIVRADGIIRLERDAT